MDPFEFYRINPNLISFTFTYPKLAWYRDEDPDTYRKIWKVLNISEFLIWYLTGIPIATFSQANRTLLFDLDKEDWSAELLGAGSIDRQILPEVVPGGEIVGNLKPDLVGELGFSSPVTVVSGGHDQCLNALGVGAITGGQSATGIGTFECTTLVFDEIPDKRLMYSLGLNIEHHVVPGKYVSLIYNQAGSLQDWFLRVYAKELRESVKTDRDALNILTDEAPGHPSGVIFIPAIEPTGAPYYSSGMNGSFHSIKAKTTRGDMYRALLEGESMFFLDTIEQLDEKGLYLDELIASGGGSRSDLWLQIKADILGKRIRRSGFINAGTVGAAILAGFALGHYTDLSEAAKLFEQGKAVLEPNESNRVSYRDQIAQFRKFFARSRTEG